MFMGDSRPFEIKLYASGLMDLTCALPEEVIELNSHFLFLGDKKTLPPILSSPSLLDLLEPLNYFN